MLFDSSVTCMVPRLILIFDWCQAPNIEVFYWYNHEYVFAIRITCQDCLFLILITWCLLFTHPRHFNAGYTPEVEDYLWRSFKWPLPCKTLSLSLSVFLFSTHLGLHFFLFLAFLVVVFFGWWKGCSHIEPVDSQNLTEAHLTNQIRWGFPALHFLHNFLQYIFNVKNTTFRNDTSDN